MNKFVLKKKAKVNNENQSQDRIIQLVDDAVYNLTETKEKLLSIMDACNKLKLKNLYSKISNILGKLNDPEDELQKIYLKSYNNFNSNKE